MATTWASPSTVSIRRGSTEPTSALWITASKGPDTFAAALLHAPRTEPGLPGLGQDPREPLIHEFVEIAVAPAEGKDCGD
jgi:hypothetical protein